MNALPTITVAIPTYNREKWLRAAVASVLEEERVPILLHILDNASSDGTQDYVKQLTERDCRVKYTRWEKNLGGLMNSFLSIREVVTEFFVPLADDDSLLPGFLFEAYQIMTAQPDLGAVIFQTQHMLSDGRIIAVNPTNERAEGRFECAAHLTDWMADGHYQWSSVLWNSAVLKTVGYPRLEIGLPNDLDFQAQAFCRFPVVRIAKPGAIFRLHSEQASLGVLRGDWSKIVSSLDARVSEKKLIAPETYRELRGRMLARWNEKVWMPTVLRGSWYDLAWAIWRIAVGLRSWDLAREFFVRRLRIDPKWRGLKAKVAIRTRLRRFCRL